MKSFVMKKALVSVMSLFAVGALVACGNNAGGKSSEEESQYVLEFRPVTTGAGSTSTDVDVTVGSYVFKLGINLAKDKTLTFFGNCQKKNQSGGGGGGPGGPGGGGMPFGAIKIDAEADGDEPGVPGGDFPGAPGGDTSENPGASSEAPASSEEEDISKKNFEKKGTWATDEYGYVLTIDSKEYHVDYIAYQYRHDFNMNVQVDDASALVHFTAYDDSFKSKDESTYAERNAQYVFQASSSEFLYLEKDHSVVTATFQGVSRTQTLPADTWTLEGDVLKVGNVVAEASINTAHPGYKLTYSGKAYFCSTNPAVSPLDMTNADIYGATTLALKGSYEQRQGPRSTRYECELDLFETGSLKFFSNGAEDSSKAGTWTKAGDVFTLNIGGVAEPVVLEPTNGVYSFELTISGNTIVTLSGSLAA